ncbi:hypothetical protein WJX72_006413 [[Myrmecia] bisecta]|uniref:DUF2470 domain-containing protein n=1 Tax=[Myrmecia] bisecta TaxID=41462 RepID=A0AAW1QR88_9CHLO
MRWLGEVWGHCRQLEVQSASLQLCCSCLRLLSTSTPAHAALDQQSQQKLLERTGLPLAQRCKNLLAGNWRGQLSTAQQEPRGKDEPAVHSSIVQYVAPRGSLPFVLLNKGTDKKHIQNLALEDRASLTVGHTDPQAVVSVLRAGGLMPARANVFAQLEQLPAGEMAYVDTMSHKHTVDIADVDGALVDQLAVSQHALLNSINQNRELRSQLALFCQAYLQAPAEDALMIQADRLGFTVLGRTPTDDGSGKPSWCEFRFQLTRELADAAALQQMLTEMRVEIDQAGQ